MMPGKELLYIGRAPIAWACFASKGKTKLSSKDLVLWVTQWIEAEEAEGRWVTFTRRSAGSGAATLGKLSFVCSLLSRYLAMVMQVETEEMPSYRQAKHRSLNRPSEGSLEPVGNAKIDRSVNTLMQYAVYIFLRAVSHTAAQVNPCNSIVEVVCYYLTVT